MVRGYRSRRIRKRRSPKNSPYTSPVPIQRKDGVVQRYWTGRRPQQPRYYPPEYLNPTINQKKLAMRVLKKGFVIGAIELVPMAREIYIGYTAAHLIYTSWKSIYKTYKNPDTLKQQAYDFARDGLRTGLNSFQTDMIWNHIESKVPTPIRNDAYSQLTNIMSNISEEEILLVEHALAAF